MDPMPFRDYVGTELVPYLLPIIPYGAPLSSKTKQLTPEKLGKIPGQRLPDGWIGFRNWQDHNSSDAVLAAYARWYKDQPCETVGINSKILLANDSDFDNNVVRDIVIDEYEKRFGQALIRARPNSFKILIPLRLAKGSQPVTKIRRVFVDAWGTIGALEVLGRGEQWVMEGMHPSGVQFEWRMGITPLVFGWDNIPEATFDQVHEFVAAVSERLITELKFQPIKISLSRGGSSPGATHKIGSDHPELCPDLDMLREVLQILPCDHPEWDLYDDWIRAVVAIKTACGGDEGFYTDVFEPWASAVPENLEEDGFLRAKWDSFIESSIGWLWLSDIAHGHGYTGDVTGVGGFEALPDEPGKPDEDAEPRPLEIGSDVEIATGVASGLCSSRGPVIFCEGEFWQYDRTHWRAIDRAELRREVHRYDGVVFGKREIIKLNKTRIDSILNEMGAMLARPNFFAEAPTGINCASGFIADR